MDIFKLFEQKAGRRLGKTERQVVNLKINQGEQLRPFVKRASRKEVEAFLRGLSLPDPPHVSSFSQNLFTIDIFKLFEEKAGRKMTRHERMEMKKKISKGADLRSWIDEASHEEAVVFMDRLTDPQSLRFNLSQELESLEDASILTRYQNEFPDKPGRKRSRKTMISHIVDKLHPLK